MLCNDVYGCFWIPMDYYLADALSATVQGILLGLPWPSVLGSHAVMRLSRKLKGHTPASSSRSGSRKWSLRNGRRSGAHAGRAPPRRWARALRLYLRISPGRSRPLSSHRGRRSAAVPPSSATYSTRPCRLATDSFVPPNPIHGIAPSAPCCVAGPGHGHGDGCDLHLPDTRRSPAFLISSTQ